jgi:hypothetical protein
MTMIPLFAFTCDSCGDEQSLVVQNTPVAQRAAPPEGWTSMKVGDDPGAPVNHLCSACAIGLTRLLARAQRAPAG